MRVVQGIVVLIGLAGMSGALSSRGEALVASRSFTGSAVVWVVRPGLGSTQQQLGVEAVFSPYRARLTVTPPGAASIPVDYGFIELPRGGTSLAVLLRGSGGVDSVLPGLVIGRAQSGTGGTEVSGFGLVSGTDALGPFSGLLLLQLQQVVVVVPPPPPPPSPSPTLPSFDGTHLRVPAHWEVRKFEGFALRLAGKYGTLPGGTTAAVPSAWTAGVMQCHGAEGFVYELPLTLSYQGFLNGSILYTPVGTFPSWEDPARWQPIGAGGGFTKHVFR